MTGRPRVDGGEHEPSQLDELARGGGLVADLEAVDTGGSKVVEEVEVIGRGDQAEETRDSIGSLPSPALPGSGVTVGADFSSLSARCRELPWGRERT